MDCKETRRLLDADVDGELDLVRHLDVEAHLRGCATCAEFAAGARTRRAALQALPRFTAPPRLAQKIQTLLRPEIPKTSVAPPKQIASDWPWGAMAAAVALALVLGFLLGSSRTRSNRLLDEAISDHVRALQTGHLTDVVSTDQHTVKPWFTGKIDFSPPVVDLSATGFPLEGGRLEYLDGRPAAALVFRHRQHPINVFIWPVHADPPAHRHITHAGYSAETWVQDDLNFIAVSEIPAAELGDFITAFRTATAR